MLSDPQITLLRRWLGISRTRLFTAVITPCFIGVAVAFNDGFFSSVHFIVLVLGVILAEVTTLFLADWVEHKGIDVLRSRVIAPPRLEGSPVLSSRVLPPRYTVHAAGITATAALVVLSYFVLERGWSILILLGIAAVAGALYVATPFRYAFFSTAFLPPVVAFGTYFAVSGIPDWEAGLSALPLLFLSAAVIYTYRVLYQPKEDARFQVRRNYLRLLYLLCYLTLLVLVFSGITTVWALFGLLSAPLPLVIDRVTKVEKASYLPATSLGVLAHTITGILIATGYLVSALL